MNDTLHYLYQSVYQLHFQKWPDDPEYQLFAQEYQRLEHQFRAAHRRNHALIHAVHDLLDAQWSVCEREEELLFLLGLQMGLELRDVHLVPDV